MKLLAIDRESCNGCGMCQASCAIAKKGVSQPSQGLLKIIKDRKRLLYFPITCQHCSEPACETACLMECISKETQSGRVIRDMEKCIGCSACLIACPFSAPIFDSEEDLVLTCDQCNGDPICEKMCPNDAISFKDINEISSDIRAKQAVRSSGHNCKGVQG